jgi:hypothetical protein
MKSAPSSRPTSPDLEDDNPSTARIMKLSFRKGGDKAFYAVLKRALMSKGWEVRRVFWFLLAFLYNNMFTRPVGLGTTQKPVNLYQVQT